MNYFSKVIGHVRTHARKYGIVAATMLVVFIVAGPTFAGTAPATTDPFYAAYTLINGWATGTLAKVIALISFLLGLGFSAAKQSAMPAIMGLVMALLVAVLPTVILSVIGAVL